MVSSCPLLRRKKSRMKKNKQTIPVYPSVLVAATAQGVGLRLQSSWLPGWAGWFSPGSKLHQALGEMGQKGEEPAPAKLISSSCMGLKLLTSRWSLSNVPENDLLILHFYSFPHGLSFWYITPGLLSSIPVGVTGRHSPRETHPFLDLPRELCRGDLRGAA